MVLIDSSAFHNFLSQHLVHNLKIPVHQQSFHVIISKDDNIKRGDKCQEVCLHLAEVDFI